VEAIEDGFEIGDTLAVGHNVVAAAFRAVVLEIDMQQAGMKFLDHLDGVDAGAPEMGDVATQADVRRIDGGENFFVVGNELEDVLGVVFDEDKLVEFFRGGREFAQTFDDGF